MSNQGGFYAAVSGAMAQEKRLEVLTNNLANINTDGYKKDVLSFRSFLNEAQSARGETDLVGLSDFRTDFTQGRIVKTGNTFDLALSGKGFFEITTAEGTRYTRQGNFMLNALYQLVTANGDLVSGSGGPLVIDGANVVIGSDGEVTVDEASVGQIKVVSFADMTKLAKAGAGLFINNGGPENLTEDLNVSVQQGYVEKSNVNMIEEMLQLIEVSRSYESYQKVIQSMDDASKAIVTELGRG